MHKNFDTGLPVESKSISMISFDNKIQPIVKDENMKFRF